MTDEQLSEILAHPRVRAFIALVVDQELRQRGVKRSGVPTPRRLLKDVPAGYLTYGQAAERYNVRQQVIRYGVHRGFVTSIRLSNGFCAAELESLDRWFAHRKTRKSA